MFDMLKKSLNKEELRCSAIIAAAGKSSRMNEIGNKQFLDILGKPILAYTIEAFENCKLIQDIIVVTREEDIVYCNNSVIQPYFFSKVKKVVAGGDHRQNSVYNGLIELDENTDIVVIHDGARPLVTVEDIERSVYECIEHKAVTMGVKVKDTIKIANNEGMVIDTPDRNMLWITQTPQTFDYSLLLKAHEKANEEGFVGSDDAVLIERFGNRLKMVEGTYRNIKVTTSEDLYIVKAFLEDND